MPSKLGISLESGLLRIYYTATCVHAGATPCHGELADIVQIIVNMFQLDWSASSPTHKLAT